MGLAVEAKWNPTHGYLLLARWPEQPDSQPHPTKESEMKIEIMWDEYGWREYGPYHSKALKEEFPECYKDMKVSWFWWKLYKLAEWFKYKLSYKFPWPPQVW